MSHKKHIRKAHWNGVLLGVLIALGLVMVSSFGAWQFQVAGGEIPFISASLGTLNQEEFAFPDNQLRQLQFGALPVDNFVKLVSLAGTEQFQLRGVLTSSRLTEASVSLRDQLLLEKISEFDALDFAMVTEVVGSFSTLSEQSSVQIGEQAPSFEYSVVFEGEIVVVPRDYIYSFIRDQYHLDARDFDFDLYDKKEFIVEKVNGVYLADVTFSASGAGVSGVLQPLEREWR